MIGVIRIKDAADQNFDDSAALLHFDKMVFLKDRSTAVLHGFKKGIIIIGLDEVVGCAYLVTRQRVGVLGAGG